MADDKKTSEANAGDLLSLWAGAGQKKAEPAPPQSQPPREEPKTPSAQPSPAPPPMQKVEPKEEQKHQPKAKKDDELLRARRSEVLEGEVVSKAQPTQPIEEKPVEFSEEERFSSQLDEFLEELHLSKKHIFYGIGCLVLLILLIIVGIFGFRYFKNRKPPVEETKVSEEQKTEKKSPQTTGIETSLGIGKKSIETLIQNTAINVSLLLGQKQAIPATIEDYILTFRRMQNAYSTNINELLNASTDRRARLKSYLALLRKLHENGMNISQKIQAELESIKTAYEREQKEQEIDDVNFFEQLNKLEADSAAHILESFIQSSVEIVRLRAQFRALQKIRDLYERSLPRVAARIRDIELNEEALVSGLKIYDVPGSDIELILPTGEESGLPSSRDSFNTPSFPLLPVHPSEVQTEKDFITVPGGGF